MALAEAQAANAAKRREATDSAVREALEMIGRPATVAEVAERASVSGSTARTSMERQEFPWQQKDGRTYLYAINKSWFSRPDEGFPGDAAAPATQPIAATDETPAVPSQPTPAHQSAPAPVAVRLHDATPAPDGIPQLFEATSLLVDGGIVLQDETGKLWISHPLHVGRV